MKSLKNVALAVLTTLFIIYIFSEPPMYKVGECFRWRHNPEKLGTISEVHMFYYKYTHEDNPRGFFVRKFFFEAHAEKVRCE